MNNTIFFFFYNLAHQSFFFDFVVIFFGFWFPFIVIGLAGLFLIFYRKNWRDFFLVFLSGGIAVLLDLILKYLIHTPRPFVAFTNISALFPESGYAFPSGHATFFSALAISLFFLNKKVGYIFIFFAVLIGIARIVAGVHFPIDILGGFILGGIVSYLFAYFVKSV